MAIGGTLTGVGDIVAYLGVGGQKDFENALKKAGDSSDKLSNQINKGLNKAIIAGSAAFVTMTLSAASFQKQMADVNTLLDGPAEQFAVMNSELLALAQTIPSSMSTLTKGLYDLVSAGAPAADSVSALGLAAKAATAGVTGVNVAVNAGMSTINAYGLGMESLTTVYDLQFSTVKKGVLTYEQLASSIGTVLPAARTLNVSLQDMYGSIAFLTKAGQSADMATTNLSRAFEALVEQKDKLAKFGVVVFDTSGKFRGMEAVVGDLAKAMTGMTDEQKLATLATLDFDIRAGRAINSMINNYDMFKQTLDDVSDSSGTMETAFKKQMDTFSSQANKFKNIVQTSFIKQGTNLLLPALQGTLTALNEYPGAIEAVITSISTLAITAGGLAVIIKGGMGIKALTTLLGPWGVGIAAILAAYMALETVFNTIEENHRKEIEQISDKIDEIGKLEDKYLSLKNEENLTAEQQRELETTVKNLKEKYHDLGIEVDATTTEIELLGDALITQKMTDMTFQIMELESQLGKVNAAGEKNIEMLQNGSMSGRDYGESMDFLAKKEKYLKDEISLLQGEFDELNSKLKSTTKETDNNVTSSDNLRKSYNKIQPIFDKYFDSLKFGADEVYNLTQMALKYNKEIELTGDGIAVLNKRFPVLNDYIKTHYEEVEHTVDASTKWYDELYALAGGFEGIIDAVGRLGNDFDVLGESGNQLIGSLENIVRSGFNPVTMAIESVSFIANTFFNKKETPEIVYTIDMIIEKFKKLGIDIQAVQDAFNALSSEQQTNYLKKFADDLDAAIERYTYLQNMDPTTRMLTGAVEEILGLGHKIEWLTERLNDLSDAFKIQTDFTSTYEDLQGITGAVIDMLDYFGKGALDIATFDELLSNSITAAQTLLASGTIVEGSQAWDDLNKQIEDATALLAYLRGETDIYTKSIENENEAIEDQIEAVKTLTEMWEEAYSTMFQQYDEFTKQMKEATSIYDQIEFFGINLDETEMDERIGHLIKSMRDYLDTLNPNSPAYAEYKKQLNELIAKYYDLIYGTDELSTSTGDAFENMKEKADEARMSLADLQKQIDEKLELKAELKADFEKLMQEKIDIINEINTKKDEHEKIQLELEIEMQGVQDQINKLGNILGDIPFQTHTMAMMQQAGALGGFYELYEILEDITGETRRLNVEWSDLLDNLFQDYDVFTTDMKGAADALEKLAYFGQDLKGSGAESEINAAIVRMQDFLATLDPNSQAYKDYQKALSELISQYEAMGGVIDRTAAGEVFDKNVNDATKDFADLLERLRTEYTNNEITFNANIQPLLDRLEEIRQEMIDISNQTIELNLDISKAEAEIERLKALIEELTGNNYKDRGGNYTNSFNTNTNNMQTSDYKNNVAPINITSSPQIIIHEATPNTWVEVIDTKIQPRINYKNRHLSISSEPYRI